MQYMQSIFTGKRATQRFLLLFLLFLCAVVGASFAEDDPGTQIAESRAFLEKYVETQRVISKEKRDLKLAKETLNNRIELVEREIESLREKIDSARESIAEADKKRSELAEQRDALKDASQTLQRVITSLEKGTRDLLAKVPDPIRERVKPLSQRMPEKPEEAKLSVSQRFQNVIGILNEINKFNREITVTSEVRTFADGTTAEVTALYMGLGQGYYVTSAGDRAGLGYNAPEGWKWEAVNEAAPEISQVIAIMKNEQIASFVPVPMKIQEEK